MSTLSEEELLANREVARALVDELIGSVVLEQSHREQSPDINAMLQQELNELEHIDHDTDQQIVVDGIETKFIPNIEIGDFITADGRVGTKFIPGVEITKLNAQYSTDLLESLELQNVPKEQCDKHVRFDRSCNKMKSNETVVYVNTPTSRYIKFTWFMTGFLTGVLGTSFVLCRRK